MISEDAKERLLKLIEDLNISLFPERNEKCYCGSNKKYKKCCENKDRNPELSSLQNWEFEITDDLTVMLDQGETLSEEDEDKLLKWVHHLAQENPKVDEETISGLQALAEKYSNPFVWEVLKRAYEAVENQEQNKRIEEELLSRFPDYFYSRFLKSTQMLVEGKLESFEECFNGCKILPALYPERKSFHLFEVTLFHLQWLKYCYLISDLRTAEPHFKILKLLWEDEEPEFQQAQKMIEHLRAQRKVAILINRMRSF